MPSDHYREVERALARQRHEVKNRESALNRAALESCASLRIADLAQVLSDAVKSSERNLIGHVTRMLALRDMDRRREKERALNFHSRITQLESELRLLAKKAHKK
jgi:hypothetical protein